MAWKVGDWVVFDLDIGQIKDLRDDGWASFSDGHIEASGMQIAERFRPLTLRSKRIVDTFDIYYNRLHEIDGNAGFNYPDISRYFSQLALDAIDGDDTSRAPYDKASEFTRDARDYKPVIQGIRLFRRA